MIETLLKLNTKRLTLRQIAYSDSKEILFLRSNEIVNTYVNRPKTQTLEETIAFIDKINNGIKEDDWLFWGITLKSNPKLIGTICLWNFSDHHKIAEIGYDLHPDFHGQGIMNEALIRVLNYGFQDLKLDQIEAYTHKDNEASKGLLKKNNFILEENRKDNENENNIVFILQKSNLINNQS
ncbi:GNAT family N-acetyltransferase [Aquimarina gracilis]|uniref:GNAT family N-acetyltransferase n=1 Tax=Aquimarina gracilis TaxID=874422 RepID=A0ABU5ZWD9_9FLAO|nr:GNAT family N-acetyltransferase [Aquimarina gracilis]MEB3346178.1 GNAT family N-acetyltransferase [Aquimarina gracilis]